MAPYNSSEDLETRIIEVAKHLFIENGFAETSMSDIAAEVGINRPGLHYYFRTKEKMFQAVFGQIITTFVPKVQGILLSKDIPILERVGSVIDAYYQVFQKNPCLPLFIIREMHRDVNHLVETVKGLQMAETAGMIMKSLQEEMEAGKIKQVPFRFIFFTFYSLLTVPFATKELGTRVFLEEGEQFEDMLKQWKTYIIMHMGGLLCVKKEGEA